MDDINNHTNKIKNCEENLHYAGEIVNDFVYEWKEGLSLNDIIRKSRERHAKFYQEVDNCQLTAKANDQNKCVAELNAKREILKNCEEREKQLQTQIEEISSKIEKLKASKAETSKHQNLLRDFVKVSKTLTGTTFDYQNSLVTGYITNKVENKFQTFKIDGTGMNSNDLTTLMWKHLEETAGSDWSNILQIDTVQND